MPDFDIHISYTVPRAGRPSAASVRKWAIAALNSQTSPASLGVHFVDEDRSRLFNGQYRGKPYPTNVLSFPIDMPELALPVPYLGDIFLCAPVIEEQARIQGKTAKAHYAHLTIHGVLHLLGWDHEIEEHALAMEQREREILAGLGYADPYADQ